MMLQDASDADTTRTSAGSAPRTALFRRKRDNPIMVSTSSTRERRRRSRRGRNESKVDASGCARGASFPDGTSGCNEPSSSF
jgi:hypothetical protein